MGVSERSEPRVCPAPAHVVFDALLAGARQVGLVVTNADPRQGLVWADKPMSLATWGESITIHVRADGPQQTSVIVESRLKFGLVAWGAHKKNFARVHQALDAGLAHGGHGGQQHGAPQQQYGAPQPQYGAPQPQYGAPQPQYGGPQFGGQPLQQPGHPQQQAYGQPPHHGQPHQQGQPPQYGQPRQQGQSPHQQGQPPQQTW